MIDHDDDIEPVPPIKVEHSGFDPDGGEYPIEVRSAYKVSTTHRLEEGVPALAICFHLGKDREDPQTWEGFASYVMSPDDARDLAKRILRTIETGPMTATPLPSSEHSPMIPTAPGYYLDANDVCYVTKAGDLYFVKESESVEPDWVRVEEFSDDVQLARDQSDFAEFEPTRIAYGIDV